MTALDKKKHLRHCMAVYAGYPYYETRIQLEAEALVANEIEVDVICPALGNENAEDEHCGVPIHWKGVCISDIVLHLVEPKTCVLSSRVSPTMITLLGERF